MRVFIVEDETAASENLVSMLREIDPDIEVAGVAESVFQTIRYLRERTDIDLIFMDIQLSDATAFSIFEQIEVTVPIVFVTAYDQYAIEAFKVNSIDYILKPVKKQDLSRALSKFRMLTGQNLKQYLERVMMMSGGKILQMSNNYDNCLLLPVKDRLIPVDVSEIACIYSTDKKTCVILKNGTSYPYTRSLDSIISCLDPHDFTRANKQYIVSRGAIKEMVIWFDSRLLIRMTVDVPEPIYVSKNKAAEFKEWMIRM